MDNYQIQTAQNVTINQSLANYFERLAAFTIDLFILIAYVIIISLLSPVLTKFSNFATIMVISLPLLLYHLVMELSLNGQSVGKAALKIRVVCTDGSKPKASHFLIRWCLRLLDITLCFGSLASLFILFGGKGQRLGDMAAKTMVISEKQRVDFRQNLMMDLPENYIPKYPQVTIFSDEDIQKAKAIYVKAKLSREFHIINKLSHQISKKMQITTSQQSIDFIESVLKDYNYYTQQ